MRGSDKTGEKGLDLYLMAFMVLGSKYFGRSLAVHIPANTNTSKISSVSFA